MNLVKTAGINIPHRINIQNVMDCSNAYTKALSGKECLRSCDSCRMLDSVDGQWPVRADLQDVYSVTFILIPCV
jgi:hypothetical protein